MELRLFTAAVCACLLALAGAAVAEPVNPFARGRAAQPANAPEVAQEPAPKAMPSGARKAAQAKPSAKPTTKAGGTPAIPPLPPAIPAMPLPSGAQLPPLPPVDTAATASLSAQAARPAGPFMGRAEIAARRDQCPEVLKAPTSDFKVAGAGGLLVVKIRNFAGCVMAIAADVDWIEATLNGPEALHLDVAPNQQAEPRRGVVMVVTPNQTIHLPVTQAPGATKAIVGPPSDIAPKPKAKVGPPSALGGK